MQEVGNLFRTNGGFWTYQGVKMVEYGMDTIPEWWVGKGTVDALITRGILTIWNTREGKYGVYPIEVTISPSYEEIIKQYKL